MPHLDPPLISYSLPVIPFTHRSRRFGIVFYLLFKAVHSVLRRYCLFVWYVIQITHISIIRQYACLSDMRGKNQQNKQGNIVREHINNEGFNKPPWRHTHRWTLHFAGLMVLKKMILKISRHVFIYFLFNCLCSSNLPQCLICLCQKAVL
jgi:hypothetical protein